MMRSRPAPRGTLLRSGLLRRATARPQPSQPSDREAWHGHRIRLHSGSSGMGALTMNSHAQDVGRAAGGRAGRIEPEGGMFRYIREQGARWLLLLAVADFLLLAGSLLLATRIRFWLQ